MTHLEMILISCHLLCRSISFIALIEQRRRERTSGDSMTVNEYYGTTSAIVPLTKSNDSLAVVDGLARVVENTQHVPSMYEITEDERRTIR